jgi:hypothetical protein
MILHGKTIPMLSHPSTIQNSPVVVGNSVEDIFRRNRQMVENSTACEWSKGTPEVREEGHPRLIVCLRDVCARLSCRVSLGTPVRLVVGFCGQGFFITRAFYVERPVRVPDGSVRLKTHQVYGY